MLAARLRSLVARYFAPRACLHHYLHMAKGNVREYFSGPEVRLKKYLYVLRPLVACLWIIRTGTMAPMEFEPTVATEVQDPAARAAIAALLERKRAGDELDRGAPIAALDGFIAGTTAIVEAEAARVPSPEMAPAADLDALVREVLLETWGAL